VLYEALPGRRLRWEIEDLADGLSEVLGRRADLVSSSALHAQLRETVLAEAQPLQTARRALLLQEMIEAAALTASTLCAGTAEVPQRADQAAEGLSRSRPTGWEAARTDAMRNWRNCGAGVAKVKEILGPLGDTARAVTMHHLSAQTRSSDPSAPGTAAGYAR